MNKLRDKLSDLGITEEMLAECNHDQCDEAADLVDAGLDMFERPARMTSETLAAWRSMKAAAKDEGIELKLVSAFRSVDYQCEVIQRKLNDGRTIEDILCVNAIPGYSEHHTGQALDLHAGDDEPLLESFEYTPAFHWLRKNAERFGFQMSYPRDNASGVDYEPWHWRFSG